MLKLFSRLKAALIPSERPERIDAKRIYTHVMKQSRNPEFYAPGLVPDTADGRMEWLSAHLAVVMHALAKHGQDGTVLSQAIYDVMVEDFDVALREEGLTDSGVKRRIKPLAKMYLTRARAYSNALEGETPDLAALVEKHILNDGENEIAKLVEHYLSSFSASLNALPLSDITRAEFLQPSLSK